jgi:hypothetical protein
MVNRLRMLTRTVRQVRFSPETLPHSHTPILCLEDPPEGSFGRTRIRNTLILV